MEHMVMSDSASAVIAEPTATYDVRGGGGVRLYAGEWGNRQGRPVLFIHGWSASHVCWARQLDERLAQEFRLVAFDNRGHGMSEKPMDPESYRDPRLWADDLAAVIDQLGLDRPVLVAWSYGGFIVSDYVRAYGEDRIGGVNLVGGAVMLKPPPSTTSARASSRTHRTPACPTWPRTSPPSGAFSESAPPSRSNRTSGARL